MLNSRLPWLVAVALAGCATGLESKPDVAAPTPERSVVVASYLDSDQAAGTRVGTIMSQLAVRDWATPCSLGCTLSVPASRAAEVRRSLHAAADGDHLAIDVFDVEP